MGKIWYSISSNSVRIGKVYTYNQKYKYYILYRIDKEKYFELFDSFVDLVNFLQFYDFGPYDESEV